MKNPNEEPSRVAERSASRPRLAAATILPRVRTISESFFRLRKFSSSSSSSIRYFTRWKTLAAALPNRVILFLLATNLCAHAQTPPPPPLRGTPIDSAPPTNAAPSASASEQKSQPAPAASTRSSREDYLEIGFDKLSGFTATVTYEVVDADKPGFYYATKLTSPIPDDIKALDGKKVAVKGFMLPLRQEQGLVTEFILLKNQMFCCFGKPPAVNEWVHVRVKGNGLKTLMDQPITISGKLQVGSYKENKTLLGMYQMDGEKMTGPQ
jgi:hypothetical protein